MRTKQIKFLKLSLVVLTIIFLFIAGYVLPIYAHDMAVDYPEYANLKNPLLFGIMLTLLPLLFSFYQAFRFLNLIEQDKIFTIHSTTTLKWIRACAVSIALLYMMGMIFLLMENALHPSLLLVGLFICLITIAISMFVSILKEILTYAISYKIENDLTI